MITGTAKPAKTKRKPPAKKPLPPERRGAIAAIRPKTCPIALDRLHPHPANREISEEDCRDLAESIRYKGLLQAIGVRRVGPDWGLPEDGLQIIFGEKRWRAARIAGLREIDCQIFECSDAQALELMATENAKREDLNPIDEARAIERLCLPEAEGGGGMTREQAGRLFGLKTGSAASNKVRLLQLPESWQKRVISGEIGESLARELLPFRDAPQLLEKILKTYDADQKKDWMREEWGTREGFRDAVENVAGEHSREFGEKRYDYEAGQMIAINDPEKLTDEQREKLQIVTFHRDGKEVRAALNTEEFDRIAREKAKKPKKAAAKKQEPQRSAAEIREQLERRVGEWRHQWIRWHVAQWILPGDWRVTRLLFWSIENLGHGKWKVTHQALAAAGIKLPKRPEWDRCVRWSDLDQVSADTSRFPQERAGDWNKLAAEWARALLTGPLDGPPQSLPPEIVDWLLGSYEKGVEDLWTTDQKDGPGRGRLLKFFELHTFDQLRPVAEKAGVPMAGAKSKGSALKLIDAAMLTRRLPLPEMMAKEKPKAKRRKGR